MLLNITEQACRDGNVGLRTLDEKPTNQAPDDRLWEGDGVGWYFDVRRGGDFRSQAWPTNASPGAVHCYWVGLKGTNVQPRFCLRSGYLEAIPKTGVEVGARRPAIFIGPSRSGRMTSPRPERIICSVWFTTNPAGKSSAWRREWSAWGWRRATERIYRR